MATKVDYYDKVATGAHSPDVVRKKLAMRSALTPDSAKLILAMVGLPARGKSVIANKLVSFLSWTGYRTRVFNAGQKRRATSKASTRSAKLEAKQPGSSSEGNLTSLGEEAAAATGGEEDKGAKVELGGLRSAHSSASFFDTADASAKAAREAIAMETLRELLDWFAKGDGDIAVFDATNSNRDRRRAVVEYAQLASSEQGHLVSVVFIESVCDDEALLEGNMLAKVRSSPDFASLDEAAALADLKTRIGFYERAYQTVEDDEGLAYVKLFNLSSKVTAHQVFGRMSKSILPYLMSLHVGSRPVLLAALRPGSFRDSGANQAFASKLAAWLDDRRRNRHAVEAKSRLEGAEEASEKPPPPSSTALDPSFLTHPKGTLRVLSSTQPAVVAAARAMCASVAPGASKQRGDSRPATPGLVCTLTEFSALNPIDRGDKTERRGEDDEAAESELNDGFYYGGGSKPDPLTTMGFHERFPGGESFADLVRRLEPALLDIEASIDEVLVLATSTPCRALRAYALNIPVQECMGATTSEATLALVNEKDAVVELAPKPGGGWVETVHYLD